MSISYTKVENSAVLRKAALYGAKEFVRVKVNPVHDSQFPFSSNFEFPECFLPKKYIALADRLWNFKTRPDEIWIATFPKTGTTWIMNIVWQLMNNLDLKSDYLKENQFYFERSILYDENNENKNDEDYQRLIADTIKLFDELENRPYPRLFKTHFPAHLLPKDIWTVKPKLINVCRDAKDVAVSMYHMFQNHAGLQYQGTMEDFLDTFLNNHITYGPFYAHIKSFQELNELDHVLLLSYEEMIADPFAGVKKISEFLNCKYNDDELKQLTEYVSFQNMRNHREINLKIYSNGFNFFRKGKAGGYRDEMSPEYIQKFDELETQYDLHN